MAETSDQLKARFTKGSTVTSADMNALVNAMTVASSTKETLKSYFETGDRPTQAQFYELIDAIFEQQGNWNAYNTVFVQVASSWTGGQFTTGSTLTTSSTPFKLSTDRPLGNLTHRAVKIEASIQSQMGSTIVDELEMPVVNPKPYATMIFPPMLQASSSTTPIELTTAIYPQVQASTDYILRLKLYIGMHFTSYGYYQLSCILAAAWTSNAVQLPITIQAYEQLNFAVKLQFYYQTMQVS